MIRNSKVKENKIRPLSFFLFLFLIFGLFFAEEQAKETSIEQIKWTYSISETYSDPIVDEVNIYLITADGSVFAFDKFTGSRKWRTEIRSQNSADILLYQNRLYLPTGRGLYSIDKNTGELIGSYETSSPILTKPIIHEGLLSIITYDGEIIVLDPLKQLSKDSFVREITLAGKTQESSLALGGKLYVILNDGKIYSVDPFSGSKYHLRTISESVWKAYPIPDEDYIYFVAEDKIYKMSKGGDISWSKTLEGWLAPPTFYEGKIYFGSNNGKFYILDNKKGELVQTFDINGAIKKKASISKNGIYIPSNDKNIYSFDIDGKERWSVSIDDWPSSPIISSGFLFVISHSGIIYGISTMGCEILSPEENTTVFSWSQFSGRAFADIGIKNIEVRPLVGNILGDWQSVGSYKEWSKNVMISGLPEGEVYIHCRVTDLDGNTEVSPYFEINYNYLSSPEKLPKIIASYPERVDTGTAFVITFTDEYNRPLTGITVQHGGSIYKVTDPKGVFSFTAPAKEGELILTASHPNYKTETITIIVQKSILTISLIAAGALIVILFIIYIYLRSRKWR